MERFFNKWSFSILNDVDIKTIIPIIKKVFKNKTNVKKKVAYGSKF